MHLFIEINAISIIQNINSDISYLVVAHTLFRIKFAIKIELDVVCERIVIFCVDGGIHFAILEIGYLFLENEFLIVENES